MIFLICQDEKVVRGFSQSNISEISGAVSHGDVDPQELVGINNPCLRDRLHLTLSVQLSLRDIVEWWSLICLKPKYSNLISLIKIPI